jgi:hypothetical protein
MTADRDTTLPRTPEQILSTLNLIGDKWLRERVLAALREAREGAERLIRETERACDMPLHMIATTLDAHRQTGCADMDEIAALRSERDALAQRLAARDAGGPSGD